MFEIELRKWNREDSRFCKAKDLRKNTVDLLCSLMEGEQKYLDHVADIACNCGWKAGIVGNRVLGTDEFRAYRREAEVVNVMSTIGKSNVLHCLCEYGRVSHGGASYTVSISYNPGATGLAPGGICGKIPEEAVLQAAGAAGTILCLPMRKDLNSADISKPSKRQRINLTI